MNPFGGQEAVSAVASMRVDVVKVENGVVSLNFVAVSPGTGELHLSSGALREGENISVPGLKLTLTLEMT